MRTVGIVLLSVLGAFAVGVLLFNFVLMPRVVQHDVSVSVPRVVGLSLAESRRVCAQAGLQLLEDKPRHSEGVPPGRVVDQSPAPATLVKRGRSVRVVLSLGEERVVVPNLRGTSLRQAGLQLDNAQLALGDVARIRAAGEGTVVRATRPRAGAEAAIGDSVDVLLTTGEVGEPYFMPNLLGQEVGDVRALIESRGFRVGRLTYRAARGVFPGTVLEQNPLRGSWIRRGESIDLVVANPD